MKAKELAINLINLFFKEIHQNAIDLDNVAKTLDGDLSLSKKGDYTHASLINKVMQSTKADPRAALGQDDPLRTISDAILKRDLLPTDHKGYKRTLKILLAMKFKDSVRVHEHEEHNMIFKPWKELISTISVVDSDVIYPEEEQPKLEDKSQKKITFKKRKVIESQEDES